MILNAVVVAPELPALSALLGAVVLVLCWAAAFGALVIWRRSLGALLIWLADLLDGVSVDIGVRTIHVFGAFSAALRSLDSTIDHYLGEAVQWSEKGAVVLFKFFTAINVWMAREIADLARDAWSAIHGSAETTRAQVQAWTRSVYGVTIHKLTVAVGALTHVTIPALRHRLDSLAQRIGHEVKVRANSIAHTLPRIGRLERGATKLGARVKRIEKQLAAGLAAGFAVAILAKAVISWLRCPSLKRALTKRSCIDFDYLDGLLTGALLIVGTISLREFAKDVEAITEEASGLIHGFLRDA